MPTLDPMLDAAGVGVAVMRHDTMRPEALESAMRNTNFLFCLALTNALTLSCRDEQQLPPVQVQGDLLSYAADSEIEVCPATVPYLEKWMVAVAARLGIPKALLLPTTYYIVDASVTTELCGGKGDTSISCAERIDDEVQIVSHHPFKRHELVHALHLAAVPHHQAILTEGVATLFDDQDPFDLGFSADTERLDYWLGLQDPRDDDGVYGAGAYLLYWVAQRHGEEAVLDLWSAVGYPASAADFRAAFELTLGESLDAMLTDVDGGAACQIVTCVGEPRPWVDGQWTMSSPRGCEDDAIGIRGPQGDEIVRHGIVEVTEPGLYEISVSAVGAQLAACEQPCSLNHSIGFSHSTAYPLAVGRYRVAAWSAGQDQPGYDVQIRPVE